MRVIVKIDGVSGLVMSNERLADPDDEYARAISELTSVPSNKRTDAQRAEIGKLEWFGGIYYDREIGVYLPSWNLIRCFEEAGKITKKGKSVIRSLAAVSDRVQIQHDGPKDLMQIWEKPEYRLRKLVGVKTARVPRTRPIFRRWSLEFEAELITETLNARDFDQIVEQAGRSEGLGSARKLGYGRFTAEVIR